LAAGWTVTLCLLLAWDFHQIRRQASTPALVDAQSSFERDVAFRRWAARHGGVYVPVTPETPPNANLAHVPERDITSPSGQALTLLNSAYISRQIHEWYENPGATQGHVTSLKPIRTENAPDPWETHALKALENGEQEVVAESTIDGKKHLRLMRPLLTEPQCLKCHASQGYREGDIRGGVSVSVPMDSYDSAAGRTRRFAAVAYSALWLLGISGIGTAGLIVNRRASAQAAADRARLESERKFRAIFNQSFHLAGVLTPDGTVIEINTCALEFCGLDLADLVGKPFWETSWWTHDPEAQARVREAIEVAGTQCRPSRFETTHRDRSGALRNIDFSLRPIKDEFGRIVLLVPEGMDVTARNQAEQEKAQLTEQLLQSQKLESIGRMAGGLAHDFNNMLSPIMGYTDLLLVPKPPDHPDRAGLQAIIDAASRARDLTQQLLACARRQPVQTRPMDLNATIRGFEPILRRSLRGNVVLELHLAGALRAILGDCRQIEQILLNLAINAQDAMPDGGRLVIETREVRLDGTEAARRGGLTAGPYALLAVTDTGKGMETRIAERVFEPFFSTKELGQGSGLGLSMAYGIVKQHGGHIELRTAPGRGTTFYLYFPATDRPVEAEPPSQRPPEPRGGHETILVVEDNEQVRRLVSRMLENWGYQVIAAGDACSALAMAAACDGPIHLLITDVIMPDMNGKVLHDQLTAGRDGLGVLYMSGYTAEVIGEKGILDQDIHFIQKPFSLDEFAGKVRRILDGSKSP
jgi:PAS domain S-box-containing protein